MIANIPQILLLYFIHLLHGLDGQHAYCLAIFIYYS